jgi:hypothetical protein
MIKNPNSHPCSPHWLLIHPSAATNKLTHGRPLHV